MKREYSQQPAVQEIPAGLLQQFEKKKMQMLFLSILFDGVGMVSYFIPGLGEGLDIAWAPIAGMLYFMMYRGMLGAMGGLFTTLEEAVPFTDIIPTFTLTWIFVYQANANKTLRNYLKKQV